MFSIVGPDTVRKEFNPLQKNGQYACRIVEFCYSPLPESREDKEGHP